MAYSSNYISTLILVSSALPSTNNAAGFNALTFTSVVGCMSIDASGDKSDDISDVGLDGRTFHIIGALDGGVIQCKFRTDLADAGQLLIKSLINLNTNSSLKIVEPANNKEWATGVWANYMALPRDAKGYQGWTAEFRVNTAPVYA